MGHNYTAPYLKYSPELAVVVEINNEALGYCVGTSDIKKFELQLENEWWPSLRRRYPKPIEQYISDWSDDDRLRQMLHQPETAPQLISDRFPAHLNLNLLREVQGKDIGGMLFNAWLKEAINFGTVAVHIGASIQNKRAIAFWRKQGFTKFDGNVGASELRTNWMGRKALTAA